MSRLLVYYIDLVDFGMPLKIIVSYIKNTRFNEHAIKRNEEWIHLLG